jgi:hypothetical protein
MYMEGFGMKNLLNLRLVIKEKLDAVLQRLQPETDYLVTDTATRLSNLLVTQLRLEAPVGKYWDLQGNQYDGGSLKNSIEVASTVKGPGFFGGLFGKSAFATSNIMMAFHGKYTLEGVPPHPIFPRDKPFLIFYWPKVQKVIKSRGVTHKGYQANNWVGRAEGKARGVMELTWTKSVNEWRIRTFYNV